MHPPPPLLMHPACSADELDELSFTELLNMDLDAEDGDVAPLPPPPSAQQAPLPGVSSVTRPRSRRGGPGTAPKGSRPPQLSAAVSSQACLCCSLIPALSFNRVCACHLSRQVCCYAATSQEDLMLQTIFR